MSVQVAHKISPPPVNDAEIIDSISHTDTVATERSTVAEGVLRILLYYDIWSHPLTAREIFMFLPVRVKTVSDFSSALATGVALGRYKSSDGYFFAPHRSADAVTARKEKERRASKLWPIARISTHIIKRFPFVRAVFVSGELSKNVATRHSDIDFLVLTAPGKLWIARTLLILFKKSVLLNRKRFFCLNYFTTTDYLSEDDHNIYVASEVVHLKPMFNAPLLTKYREANRWVESAFPNLQLVSDDLPGVSRRRSVLQWLAELPFLILPSEQIDRFLQRFWQRTWRRRYPHFDEATLEHNFTSSETRSRAYVGNFQEKILDAYRQNLQKYGLEP